MLPISGVYLSDFIMNKNNVVFKYTCITGADSIHSLFYNHSLFRFSLTCAVKWTRSSHLESCAIVSA